MQATKQFSMGVNSLYESSAEYVFAQQFVFQLLFESTNDGSTRISLLL